MILLHPEDKNYKRSFVLDRTQLFECDLCKSLVEDKEGHDEYHQTLLKLIYAASIYGMNIVE